MSLFDQNINHYIDPANDSPAYNKDLYSLPVVGHSCYILISDNKTFIIKHVVDNPPATETELAATEDSLISLLVALGSVEIKDMWGCFRWLWMLRAVVGI